MHLQVPDISAALILNKLQLLGKDIFTSVVLHLLNNQKLVTLFLRVLCSTYVLLTYLQEYSSIPVTSHYNGTIAIREQNVLVLTTAHQLMLHR